ncbi:MAG: HEAT repeat domain-containing protein [Phormidesmis sp.]
MGYSFSDSGIDGSELAFDTAKSSQNEVDWLIAHVNEQIELLAFDDPDPALLRRLVDSLADSRQSTRFRLVEALSQIGESATPFLLEGIAHSPRPIIRRACCNALTNIGDPASVSGLISALSTDSDIGVKSSAAGALAKVGEPAFDALVALLASDSASESCKGHAAWAIASMSDEVSNQLYDNRHHASPAVRTAMLGALAQLAQKQMAMDLSKALKRTLGAITDALSDDSSEVRIEAIATLARLNDRKAYKPIAAGLKDSEADVRKAAALALARLGNLEAIEAIAPLEQDSDESVRRIATLAIGQLKEKQKT